MEGEAHGVYSPTDVGTGKAKDEKALLSEIISVLNERFGTEFDEEDLFFQQIKERATRNFIQRMADNDRIVTRYMADAEFQRAVFPILARGIFEAIQKNAQENDR